jgi:hypothetical protein
VSRTPQLYARCLYMHVKLEIDPTEKARDFDTYYILYVSRSCPKRSEISSNHGRCHRLLSRHSPMHSAPIDTFEKGRQLSRRQ